MKDEIFVVLQYSYSEYDDRDWWQPKYMSFDKAKCENYVKEHKSDDLVIRTEPIDGNWNEYLSKIGYAV